MVPSSNPTFTQNASCKVTHYHTVAGDDVANGGTQ